MLVSIPMMGAVSSLNVSVAGGIVMYEVQRQRRQAKNPTVGKPAKKAAKKRKEE
jgi:23S rRNA (guanosine2251-2'-O)-methyltransferase